MWASTDGGKGRDRMSELARCECERERERESGRWVEGLTDYVSLLDLNTKSSVP